MLARTNTASTAHVPASIAAHSAFAGLPGGAVGAGVGMMWPSTEVGVVHQQITDLANKRISTLDYLRKAYVKGCRMKAQGQD